MSNRDLSAPLRYDWIEQPDDITCGPSCLAMIHASIARRHGVIPFDDSLAICAMIGTDAVTGTTPDRIRTGLAGLGLAAEPRTGAAGFRASWDEAARRGDPLLLRTITQGVKHWVLATEVQSRSARLLDPWLGDSTSSFEKTEALVAPRDHEAWLVDGSMRPREVSIVPASDQRSQVLDLMAPEFARFIDGQFEAYLNETADWGISEALLVDGRLVGAYLLKERDPSAEGIDLPADFLGLNAVEGVALAVAPDMRGMGYGRILRDRPRALGYEMAWGLQIKGLANLENWTAHRSLIGETSDSWVTARRIHQPELAAMPAP